MLTNAVITGVAAHPMWGWGPGFGWFFLLIPLFWILIFALVFSIFGRRWRRNIAAGHPGGPGYYGYPGRWAGMPGNGTGQGTGTGSAEHTLAERFAHGDIDEAEYRARLDVLKANRPDGPVNPQP